MQSRSRSAKRSSTRAAAVVRAPGRPAGVLAAATVVAATAGGVGLVLGRPAVALIALVAATALAGGFAVLLFLSERRRHESAEDRLQGEARFLESLVGAISAVADSRDAQEVLDRACAEARTLFRAGAVRIIPADHEPVRDPHEVEDGVRVPLRTAEAPIGTLELRRADSFARAELMAATVLADATSRAVENARLLADARGREDERARLTERLITAEQDERRRLSIFLHDGPLQSMSGIALMHDAALAAIEEGRHDDAAKVIASALARERETIRTLRDLSFAIEPLVLRDRGFAAAVEALADQVESSHGIPVEADASAGERLGPKAQVALYQLVREAVSQAVRRRPSGISVRVAAEGDRFVTEICDDGVGERRRGGIDELDERVRVLNGRVSVETSDQGGTTVRVVLPAYASAPAG